MVTYTAYQVPEATKPFEKVKKTTGELSPGFVRVKVHACGICHSDSFTVEGAYPGVSFPRAPGHEVAGEVAEVGPGVTKWQKGDRVGIGWFGESCNSCNECDEGDRVVCQQLKVTGIHFDGGYSEYVVAPSASLARIPDKLSYVEAAPLLCAGVTVYNGLRINAPMAGATVGVVGIGGLGHLAIQFARQMGYKVIVLSRGADKKDLALKLGGHVYLDTNSPDFVAEAQKLGGIKVLLATATSVKAMEQALPTLAVNGTMVVLGAAQGDIPVSPIMLIAGKRKITGSASGTAHDSQDCMNFAALSGVRSMNEVYPVAKIQEAYDKMMSGTARFRVCVDWDA